MKTPIWSFGFLVAAIGGCLFSGDGTQGLPCNTDTECGGTQTCIEQVCGGPTAVATDVSITVGSSEESGSSGDEAPMTTNDDDVRTQCEASETECLDDSTLRQCTDDGKLSTMDCNGWCGQGAAHNGCQQAPDGSDTCFCLNPPQPCTEEGDYECDGDNYTRCVDGLAMPYDCDDICVGDGFPAGAESCGLNAQGYVTCFCFEGSTCEDGATRCVDDSSAASCYGGSWETSDCSEIECPAGSYSRGCTYFPGDTEGCGCWEL